MAELVPQINDSKNIISITEIENSEGGLNPWEQRSANYYLFPEVRAEQIVSREEWIAQYLEESERRKTGEELKAEKEWQSIPQSSFHRQVIWGMREVAATGALVTGLGIAWIAGAFDRPVKPTIPDINKHQTSSTVIPPKALVKQR